MRASQVLLFIESFLTGNYSDLRFKLAIVGIMWFMVTVSIALDLISGWRKAKERGEARTSFGLRSTVTKAVLYYALMLFAFMFDCIGTFFYPLPYVTFLAAAFLIFIEAKSILEKAHDKDKRKLHKSMKELGIILENKEDLIKGIAEFIKNQTEEQKITENESNK